MRLSVIFLAVLALSAIVTSMAAWGITYGTSYSRLSTMALQFTALAQDSLAGFGSFVTDLLGGNSALVESVLAAQEQSSAERTAETQAQMAQTIGVLVNYTANSTDRTQQQMNGVVDAFGALMGAVVGQFKGLAGGYVAQVRADLAVKGTAAILTSTSATLNVIQRFQLLINNGLLNLTRAPTDPVNYQDCTLLGVLCDTATEVGLPFTLVSSTGRYYTCGGTIFTVTYRTSTATQYSEFQMNWFTFSAAQAAVPPKQRCLTESPIVSTVGKNCTLPFNCTCGKDMRCYSWYQPFVNTTNTSYIGGMFPDPILQMHTAMSLFDFSATPPTFLGVIDSTQTTAVTQKLLPSLPGISNQTYMTVVLNDTYLTTLANGVRACAPGFTKPANASLPTQSAFRSCDMGIRAVAQWIVDNRTGLVAPVTLEVDGILWDVTPITTVTSSYFFIVGSNKSESYQAIDASEAKASAQLAAVRSALTSQVAAAGVATRDYVAALGAQNLLATQAMQETFLAEIWELENASRVTLADSQARSMATSHQMTLAQTAAVESERTTELNTMNVTAGWTIAVVVCLLLAVLGLSAFGTTRVTNNLTHIIGLMEDVADMKVESLAIPQGSSVQEVARIQTAFEVLVLRLAEYKSYIPAGVFERLRQAQEDDRSEDGHETDHRSSAGPETGRSKQWSPHRVSHSGTESRPMAHRPSSVCSSAPLVHVLGRRSATRPVAVLAVNVVGTMDLLRAANEVASKIILNEYVTLVHEAVLQGRGNIDFLSGDQIFVTFNAHVPCSDPPGSAMSVALDLKEQLLDKLGDKLKFRVGLAFGPVFSSTVGYTKFKFMASFGSPMKVSNFLAHLDGLDNGTILVIPTHTSA